jgi:hypothetical protein
VLHEQARGVQSILAVDLAQPMLDALERQHPPPAAAEAPGVGGCICTSTADPCDDSSCPVPCHASPAVRTCIYGIIAMSTDHKSAAASGGAGQFLRSQSMFMKAAFPRLHDRMQAVTIADRCPRRACLQHMHL